MNKRLITATLLTTALLASPVTQAASYQDRAMTTGAVVGATSGAVIGSNNNQAVEGAIFGAVLGTIAGAIIASNQQPTTVVHTHHRPIVKRHIYHHPRPVVRHRVYRRTRPVVERHVHVHQRPIRRVAERRIYDRHDRYGHSHRQMKRDNNRGERREHRREDHRS